MHKGSAEAVVRRNITLPASVADRLEKIKVQRAKVSDSEAIREMIAIMEILTGERDVDVMLKNRRTGQETLVLIPK
jgi:metal-responsive CopG/Arc/MetJ family transcriptional regulator